MTLNPYSCIYHAFLSDLDVLLTVSMLKDSHRNFHSICSSNKKRPFKQYDLKRRYTMRSIIAVYVNDYIGTS